MTTNDTPSDGELIEGSAHALGLDPVFNEAGYWTVAARAGSITKRTVWNPLRAAADSQRLQANLTIATYTHEDGGVDAAVRHKEDQHMVHIEVLPEGREATLRRAIAHVAFMKWKGTKHAAG